MYACISDLRTYKLPYQAQGTYYAYIHGYIETGFSSYTILGNISAYDNY